VYLSTKDPPGHFISIDFGGGTKSLGKHSFEAKLRGKIDFGTGRSGIARKNRNVFYRGGSQRHCLTKTLSGPPGHFINIDSGGGTKSLGKHCFETKLRPDIAGKIDFGTGRSGITRKNQNVFYRGGS